jgi:hypothetical protein
VDLLLAPEHAVTAMVGPATYRDHSAWQIAESAIDDPDDTDDHPQKPVGREDRD